MTICIKCAFFLSREPNSVRADVWYNHLCKANPLPTEVDPTDGVEKPVSTNDFGRKYFSDNKYQYCREINSGNCNDFVPDFIGLEVT